MTKRATIARLAAQLLAGSPARSVVEVARRIVAVQAQDPRGARLAVRARTSGLRAADVDRALTVDRSIVISWLNRGTLHLVTREDYWWLHHLTTPQLRASNARRLAQEGVSPSAADKGVAVVVKALSAHGPLTRGDLRERVAAAGVPVARQALVHILLLASLRSNVIRGPMVGREQAFVLARDWFGDAPPTVDHDVALRELGRRYLAGHGPASDRDLARWAGLTLRNSRRAFNLIADELAQHDDGLVDLRDRPPPPELPPPRLLGSYEPLLLGWVSREPLLGNDEQTLVTNNGLFRPFALVRGRAVSTWSLHGKSVKLSPFARLTGADRECLDEDAADVVRFLTTE